MKLLRSLKYGFTGGQTLYLQQKMQRFIPQDQNHIYDLLNQLYARREYLPFHTPTFSMFTTSIQKHYLKQKEFDRKSLRIYNLLQKMQMMSDNTKRIFHTNICRYLASERTQEGIKSQRLEHLLWWLYRQFPYQFNRFQQIASNYTVRLYDIFQYMNTIDKLPAWQPYIRVSHMLKSLGHEVTCRTDMFSLQILQNIDRKYYLYLTQLFTTQMYPQFVKSLKIHTSLPEFLCEHYIIGDEVDYDKYLQRIQVIDNIQANQEINCTMDSISWKDLVEGWKLAAHAFDENSLTEIHNHKYTQMFWRKLQTSDIPIEDITTLLQLMVNHPTLFFQKRISIIMRMVDSLYEKRDEDIEFFAANGYKELLQVCEFLPMDGPSIKKLTHFLYEKIMVLLNWSEGNAQEILEIVQKKQFDQKSKVIEFLNKKIREGK